MARFLRRTRDSFLYNSIRFFRIRAESEKVARGFALGLIINFIPTFGFGVLISGFLARALGGHLVAGVVGGASLAFFWPFLFAINYRMGQLLIGRGVGHVDAGAITEKTMNALANTQAFIYGTAANCLLFGLAVYLVMLFLFRHVQTPLLAYFRERARHVRRHRRSSTRRLDPGPGILPPAGV